MGYKCTSDESNKFRNLGTNFITFENMLCFYLQLKKKCIIYIYIYRLTSLEKINCKYPFYLIFDGSINEVKLLGFIIEVLHFYLLPIEQ